MKPSAYGNPVLLGSFILLFSFTSQAALWTRDLNGDLSDGHEGIYDDVLDITWLADANLAASESFGLVRNEGEGTGNAGEVGAGGKMRWEAADQWIANMNTQAYLGYSNWRMPNISPQNGSAIDLTFSYDGSSDRGFNISAPQSLANPNPASEGFTGNELAWHYYNNFQAISRDGLIGFPNGVGSVPTTVHGLENALDPNGYIGLFDHINFLSGYDVYWQGLEVAGIEGSYFNFSNHTGAQGNAGPSNHYFVWAVHDGDIGAVSSSVPIPATAWLFCSGLLGLLGIYKINYEV